MTFNTTKQTSESQRVDTAKDDYGDGNVKQRSRNSSNASSIASFHSARLTSEEEARSLSQSNDLKQAANAQFAQRDYSAALTTYDRAVAELPSYLDFELAILRSNIAACHLRLEQWKEAVQAAENGMDGLNKILPMGKSTTGKAKGNESTADSKQYQNSDSTQTTADTVVELPDENDDAANEQLLRNLDISDQRKADIHRIRTKLLLRRARAHFMLGTTVPAPAPKDEHASTKTDTSIGSSWSNLSSAQADYHLLSQPEFFNTLPASDQKTVRDAVAALPRLVDLAKEKEVAEMMGKLKDLGNMVLKPFGMSTDMFKVNKDPNTGGMSLSFDGGNKKP